jgi:hypothetical protein
MNRFRWLVIVTLLGSARPCCAGTAVQQQGAASLAVRYEGAEPQLALADTITVTLTVEGSPALRVQAPHDLPAGAPWILVERSKAQRASIGPQRVLWQLVYRFAPRQPGQGVFQFPDIKYRDDDNEDHAVSWKEITFTITTQITKLDRAQIRGVPDIERLPPSIPGDPAWRWWVLLAGLSLLLAMTALGLHLWLRRAARASPAERALHEWHRLVALKLPEQRRSERFITLLTMLLRRYLERQHHWPARRQTTPEFLQAVTSQALFSTEDKQFLSTFLRRVDAIKFANVDMPMAECIEWAEQTRQFLQRQIV